MIPFRQSYVTVLSTLEKILLSRRAVRDSALGIDGRCERLESNSSIRASVEEILERAFGLPRLVLASLVCLAKAFNLRWSFHEGISPEPFKIDDIGEFTATEDQVRE